MSLSTVAQPVTLMNIDVNGLTPNRIGTYEWTLRELRKVSYEQMLDVLKQIAKQTDTECEMQTFMKDKMLTRTLHVKLLGIALNGADESKVIVQGVQYEDAEQTVSVGGYTLQYIPVVYGKERLDSVKNILEYEEWTEEEKEYHSSMGIDTTHFSYRINANII